MLIYVEGMDLGWGLLILCYSDIQGPMGGTEANEADKTVD